MLSLVIPRVRTPCRAFNRACSVAGNWDHWGFQAQEMTTPPVSVIPYPCPITNPSDSARRMTGAGGGDPPVSMWTGLGRGSGLGLRLMSMLRTTGAAHMWVTWWRRMAAWMAAPSNLRRQMLVPPTAAIPHVKVHPLEWNIGRVHRKTGWFGTLQSINESIAIMNEPLWQWTTPFGDDVVPDV
uniref:Uncharacterized protein n=1 Tax=Opuntia streptacantha TaxID=393608 RepID=A0A7C8ZZ76_OPUST